MNLFAGRQRIRGRSAAFRPGSLRARAIRLRSTEGIPNCGSELRSKGTNGKEYDGLATQMRAVAGRVFGKEVRSHLGGRFLSLFHAIPESRSHPHRVGQVDAKRSPAP